MSSYVLPPDVAQLVQDQLLATGQYETPEHVLRDALQALTDRDADADAIREGLADMEAGRTRPLREVANEIRRKHGFAGES